MYVDVYIAPLVVGIVLFAVGELLHGRIRFWVQAIASAIMMYCSAVFLLTIFGSLCK